MFILFHNVIFMWIKLLCVLLCEPFHILKGKLVTIGLNVKFQARIGPLISMLVCKVDSDHA
uniref:Uncharacterized protein n=1 Tax=Rhizophora mucronata TaxID=61149 RepID=A0A2P2NZ77_RHIMU